MLHHDLYGVTRRRGGYYYADVCRVYSTTTSSWEHDDDEEENTTTRIVDTTTTRMSLCLFVRDLALVRSTKSRVVVLLTRRWSTQIRFGHTIYTTTRILLLIRSLWLRLLRGLPRIHDDGVTHLPTFFVVYHKLLCDTNWLGGRVGTKTKTTTISTATLSRSGKVFIGDDIRHSIIIVVTDSMVPIMYVPPYCFHDSHVVTSIEYYFFRGQRITNEEITTEEELLSSNDHTQQTNNLPSCSFHSYPASKHR